MLLNFLAIGLLSLGSQVFGSSAITAYMPAKDGVDRVLRYQIIGDKVLGNQVTSLKDHDRRSIYFSQLQGQPKTSRRFSGSLEKIYQLLKSGDRAFGVECHDDGDQCYEIVDVVGPDQDCEGESCAVVRLSTNRLRLLRPGQADIRMVETFSGNRKAVKRLKKSSARGIGTFSMPDGQSRILLANNFDGELATDGLDDYWLEHVKFGELQIFSSLAPDPIDPLKKKVAVGDQVFAEFDGGTWKLQDLENAFFSDRAGQKNGNFFSDLKTGSARYWGILLFSETHTDPAKIARGTLIRSSRTGLAKMGRFLQDALSRGRNPDLSIATSLLFFDVDGTIIQTDLGSTKDPSTYWLHRPDGTWLESNPTPRGYLVSGDWSHCTRKDRPKVNDIIPKNSAMVYRSTKIKGQRSDLPHFLVNESNVVIEVRDHVESNKGEPFYLTTDGQLIPAQDLSEIEFSAHAGIPDDAHAFFDSSDASLRRFKVFGSYNSNIYILDRQTEKLQAMTIDEFDERFYPYRECETRYIQSKNPDSKPMKVEGITSSGYVTKAEGKWLHVLSSSVREYRRIPSSGDMVPLYQFYLLLDDGAISLLRMRWDRGERKETITTTDSWVAALKGNQAGSSWKDLAASASFGDQFVGSKGQIYSVICHGTGKSLALWQQDVGLQELEKHDYHSLGPLQHVHPSAIKLPDFEDEAGLQTHI